MSKNCELELYKLIMSPEESEDSYVSEMGWVNDAEFFVWVSLLWIKEFVERIVDIFGYGIFDDGNFNASMQYDSVCIDLADVLDGYVDIEEVFPKDKYRH